MGKSAKLTVQKWRNSLAVRNSSVVVTPPGDTKLTLAEKLKLFDPQQHGGEALLSERVGVEVM